MARCPPKHGDFSHEAAKLDYDCQCFSVFFSVCLFVGDGGDDDDDNDDVDDDVDDDDADHDLDDNDDSDSDGDVSNIMISHTTFRYFIAIIMDTELVKKFHRTNTPCCPSGPLSFAQIQNRFMRSCDE